MYVNIHDVTLIVTTFAESQLDSGAYFGIAKGTGSKNLDDIISIVILGL